MKNYKIVYKLPEISLEESIQLADFDQLLNACEKGAGQTNWRGIALSTGIFAIAIYGFFMYSPEAEIIKPQSSSEEGVFQRPQAQESGSNPEPGKATIAFDESDDKKERGRISENEKEAYGEPANHQENSIPKTHSEVIDKKTTFIEAAPIDGFPALYGYFDKNLKYPEEALDDKVEGSVIIRFVIDTLGNPIELRVEKQLDDLLDKTAIELIKNMPKWKPALLNGAPIESTHRIPLFFNVEENQEQK